MKKVLVICGPTASGKTSLAVECAKRLNSEVISADSMLVYKYCDIGTAKPTEEEKRGVRHHLIDVAYPEDEFSVSDYENTAIPIMDRLLSENKVPVICGGTGFYIKSLLFTNHYGSTPKSDAVREKYERILADRGAQYLHSLLEAVDEESAEKLHYNDTKRVIRALEIFDLTGRKKSEQNDKEDPRVDFLCYNYNFDRSVLYQRIEKRVDIMFDCGLMDEVKSLMDRGITDSNQCMQGIGYKEVYYGIKNNVDIEQIKDHIKQNTRNYAKRQITFFKKMPSLFDLSPYESLEKTAERIIENYE